MCGCDGSYLPHEVVSPDPAGLRIEAVEVLASQGRGDSTAPETFSPVGVQTQEVPWFFARTERVEEWTLRENSGAQGHVPAIVLDRMPPELRMAVWLETHPTVIREPLPRDDGLTAMRRADVREVGSCPS